MKKLESNKRTFFLKQLGQDLELDPSLLEKVQKLIQNDFIDTYKSDIPFLTIRIP